jgi:hypothetical protein
LLGFLLTVQGRVGSCGCLFLGEPFKLILDITVVEVPERIFLDVRRVGRRNSSDQIYRPLSTFWQAPIFESVQPTGRAVVKVALSLSDSRRRRVKSRMRSEGLRDGFFGFLVLFLALFAFLVRFLPRRLRRLPWRRRASAWAFSVFLALAVFPAIAGSLAAGLAAAAGAGFGGPRDGFFASLGSSAAGADVAFANLYLPRSLEGFEFFIAAHFCSPFFRDGPLILLLLVLLLLLPLVKVPIFASQGIMLIERVENLPEFLILRSNS